MTAEPLEQQIQKLWRERIGGSPEVLTGAVEGREYASVEETFRLYLRIFEVTRDSLFMLAREIDEIKRAGRQG